MQSDDRPLALLGLEIATGGAQSRTQKRSRSGSPLGELAATVDSPLDSFPNANAFPGGLASMAKGTLSGPVLVEVASCLDTASPLRPARSLLSTSNFAAATEDADAAGATTDEATDAPRLLKLSLRDSSGATMIGIE
jgi:hypothetical protein